MQKRPVTTVALAALCAGLPPVALHAALAATAGTLFEAAPFVLVTELAVACRLRGLATAAALAGCGCACGPSASWPIMRSGPGAWSRTGPWSVPGAWFVPGALSLPATAVCWLAFGPVVALGRVALAGLASLAWTRRLGRERRIPCGEAVSSVACDPFAELLQLVPTTLVASLVLPLIANAAPVAGMSGVSAPLGLAGHAGILGITGSVAIPDITSGAAIIGIMGGAGLLNIAGGAGLLGIAGGAGLLSVGGAVAEFLAGLALGALMPCATAGVAVAAGLRSIFPAAAAGLLASSGVICWRLPAFWNGSDPARKPATDGRFASMLLALDLAFVAARGPAGLINPRLVPVLAVGAVLAAVRFRRRSTRAGGAAVVVPLLMLGALVAGSPLPSPRLQAVDAVEAASAPPGSRLTFVGTALRGPAGTLLERFAITCCRLDATPVAVRLDRRLSVPDGTWISATGVVRRGSSGGPVLEPAAWRRIVPPRDPFIYR